MKKMSKLLIIVIAFVLLMGCGSTGISQEEYDKVVEEKDALLIEQENIDWYNIGKQKLIEDAEAAKSNIKEEYAVCLNCGKRWKI